MREGRRNGGGGGGMDVRTYISGCGAGGLDAGRERKNIYIFIHTNIHIYLTISKARIVVFSTGQGKATYSEEG